MEEILEILKPFLKNIPSYIIDSVRSVIQDHEDRIIEDMQYNDVIHTAEALIEAKLSEEKIISILQKQHDLRRSEAIQDIKIAKFRLSRDEK